MATNFITPRKTGYYRCGRRYRLGRHACSQSKTLRAEETEALIWGFVSGILREPARLQRGLDEMLRQEEALAPRHTDGDEEGWLRKLSELETQEERLLDLYLEGKLEADRYASRISQIKRSRRTIEDELGRINDRAAHRERLKHDRDALSSHYSRIVPEQLGRLGARRAQPGIQDAPPHRPGP